MTDTTTRAIPTPGDVATAPRPVIPPRPGGTYDRHQWERALLAAPLPHHNARLLGLILSHVAGPAGHMPAGGRQRAARLADLASISAKQAHVSLYQLQLAGLIDRPDIATWQPRDMVRPITLTVPSAAARTEPPHPTEAVE